MVLKVLFVGSSPIDQDPIRGDKEITKIWEVVKDNILFIPAFGENLGEVYQAALTESPNIIHFSGHGSKSGELIFENNGHSRKVDLEVFVKFFQLLTAAEKNIFCVVFNACYSDVFAKAIAEHVDYAVGVSGSIDDETAILFSKYFYIHLSKDPEPMTAFASSCLMIEDQCLNAAPFMLTGRKVPFTLDKNGEDIKLFNVTRLINETIQSQKYNNSLLEQIKNQKILRVDILGIDCFDKCHLQLTLQCDTRKNIVANTHGIIDDFSIVMDEAICSFNKLVKENGLFPIVKINEDGKIIRARWNKIPQKDYNFPMDESPYLILTIISTE